MEIRKAERQSVPMSIAIGSPTGGGKTFTALLLAAGLANGGKVGFVDTEMGRGSMYADDAEIMAALPQGYDVIEMSEPFTPEKYIEALRMFRDYAVVITDSTTHEWEGSGGCQDIAENNKLRGMPNWALAKLHHKRFSNTVTQYAPHAIYCLRAREKTKPMKNDEGKLIMVEQGMQPICEKNFMFEMTLSMLLDADHIPQFTKLPKALKPIFADNKPLTKEHGELLKAWTDGGKPIDKILRALKQEVRDVAMFGGDRLNEFFKNLAVDKKKLLTDNTDAQFQKECRSLADEADRIAKEHKAATEESGGMFQ